MIFKTSPWACLLQLSDVIVIHASETHVGTFNINYVWDQQIWINMRLSTINAGLFIKKYIYFEWTIPLSAQGYISKQDCDLNDLRIDLSAF